ncbi:hypothetical protein RI049_13125 [Cedecea neteri]|uniref:helix-turn-helix transcriptional regulator n=1 Tax=Cedecea neteri TaxID=158822 RepID=UPI002AA7D78F|nr:hypothetical protein [Cedecea neteri]WPU21037.1 hypothetical protein RI049_13125 [Cedecea neteri]
MYSEFNIDFPAKRQSVKNIVVVANCTFTILGIKALCESKSHWRVTNVTANQAGLNEIVARPHVDLLIIESDGLSAETSALFMKLNQYSHKAILLTNRYSGGQRKINVMPGSITVVDKSRPLAVLQKLLHKTINNTQDGPIFLPVEVQHRARKIERDVVCALLNGENPHAVAAAMGITYAAVSRYKMIALRRAGAESLNEVIAGNYQALFIG